MISTRISVHIKMNPVPGGGSNVLAVSATDAADQIAGFSTSGNFIDVSAPGVEIYSTGQAGDMIPTAAA